MIEMTHDEVEAATRKVFGRWLARFTVDRSVPLVLVGATADGTERVTVVAQSNLDSEQVASLLDAAAEAVRGSADESYADDERPEA